MDEKTRTEVAKLLDRMAEILSRLQPERGWSFSATYSGLLASDARCILSRLRKILITPPDHRLDEPLDAPLRNKTNPKG